MTADVLTSILRDLPDLPQEVAAQWLAPHAARPEFGWPPPQDGRTEPWSAILAGRPLTWWQARHWHRDALPMMLDVMAHATRFHVERLVKAAQERRDYLPDSVRRIDAIRACLCATGRLPVPPVAFPDADGLALADGHHRFAALLMERASGTTQIDATHAIWIALPA